MIAYIQEGTQVFRLDSESGQKVVVVGEEAGFLHHQANAIASALTDAYVRGKYDESKFYKYRLEELINL